MRPAPAVVVGSTNSVVVGSSGREGFAKLGLAPLEVAYSQSLQSGERTSGRVRGCRANGASVREVELEPLLLREGQLILAGKGIRHFAWAYRTAAGPCIASSLFCMLTIRTEGVDPRYLALVLNSASCGRALTAIAKGATLPVIPKRELANLSVPVPPLDRQLAIVKLHDLQQ